MKKIASGIAPGIIELGKTNGDISKENIKRLKRFDYCNSQSFKDASHIRARSSSFTFVIL